MLTRLLRLKLGRVGSSTSYKTVRKLQTLPQSRELPLLSHINPSSELPSPDHFPLYHAQPEAGPSRIRDLPPHQHLRSTTTTLNAQYSPARAIQKARRPAARDAKISNVPTDASLRKREKQAMTRAIEDGLEEYSEEELRDFYVNVVKSGLEQARISAKGKERATERLGAPSNRIRVEGAASNKTDALGIRSTNARDGRSVPTVDELEGLDSINYEAVFRSMAERVLLSALEGDQHAQTAASESPIGPRSVTARILNALEVITPKESAGLASAVEASQAVRVPLGVLSKAEWSSLLHRTILLGERDGLLRVLSLMGRHGSSVDRHHLADLLQLCAVPATSSPGVKQCANVLIELLKDQNEPIHSVIQSYHLATDPSASSAISHLKAYESIARPLPQPSYAQVLEHLTTSTALHRPTAASRALAWDLLAHMRLVAHPTPSPEVYRTMIIACAASSDPKPEMARDLWMEMTTPGPGQTSIPCEPEYTAIIRALCSTKGTYLEGFELFRQMLARHEEAIYTPFGRSTDDVNEGDEDSPRSGLDSPYIPSPETWKALLEGTKRAGDLARARWVLGEATRLGNTLGIRTVDEEVISSLFMTYAAWKPTVQRANIKSARHQSAEDDLSGPISAASASEVEITERNASDSSDDPLAASSSPAGASVGTTQGSSGPIGSTQQAGEDELLGSRLPLTSTEAIREVTHIMTTLISSQAPESRLDEHIRPPMEDIPITPRMVNSYLSVYFAHATNAECRQAWAKVWAEVDARPNGWSYLQALERCAMGQRGREGEDRKVSLEWAEELWREYRSLNQGITLGTNSEPGNAYTRGFGPRQIERAWRAYIRTQALCGSASKALDALNEFHTLYPPGSILDTFQPSTSHALSIRFTDPTTLPESDVPPYLLFSDVDVLHQRFVRDDDWKSINRVKWVCKSYEGALKRRRKWRLKRGPPPKVSRPAMGGGQAGKAVAAHGGGDVEKKADSDSSSYL